MRLNVCSMNGARGKREARVPVRPELVAEITYLGWADEPLLRHTVFVGLREDKPANEVRRELTRPN